MLKKILLIFFLTFSIKTFAELPEDNEPLMEDLKRQDPIEHSQNPYTIIGHPDFAFENFDLDILEREEEEEIVENNTKCNKVKRYTSHPVPFDYNEAELNSQSKKYGQSSFPFNDTYIKEFAGVSYKPEIPEECEKNLFDVIHNNLNTFHDIENVRHINKNH